jgi:hypothetical protein
MDIIVSKRPSGRYYLVRLIAPYRFKPSEEVREPGTEWVVDENLANHLSSNFIAAVLYRQENQRIWVPT